MVVVTLGSIVQAGYFIYITLDVMFIILTNNNDVNPFIHSYNDYSHSLYEWNVA